MLNLRTGERFALRCKANTCHVCGPINARLIARAQARSNPERMFRFSLMPTTWQEARVKVKQVRERLRDLGVKGNEWAWSLEPNPSGEDVAHLHGVQHGPYIDQGLLQHVCQRQGLGIPYIEAIKGREAAATYGVKAAGAAFYGVKSARDAEAHQDEYRRFLTLNGGRISHHTRGFYRLPDGTPATQGQAISATIEAIREEHGQQEDESWHVVERGLSLQSARLRRLRALGTPMDGKPL